MTLSVLVKTCKYYITWCAYWVTMGLMWLFIGLMLSHVVQVYLDFTTWASAMVYIKDHVLSTWAQAFTLHAIAFLVKWSWLYDVEGKVGKTGFRKEVKRPLA